MNFIGQLSSFNLYFKCMLFHLQEFELDKDIKLELDKQKHDRIDIVRKELAWEAEKQRIALEKLRKRYIRL